MPNAKLVLLRILGAVVALLLAAGGGAYWMHRYDEGQQAIALAAAEKSAIDGARQEAATLADAYYQTGLRNAAADARQQSITAKGLSDAAAKSSVACNRDAVSIGLLNDAINSVNADQAAPGAVPDKVPGSTKAGFGLRLRDSAMGILPHRLGGEVSPAAQ